MKIIFKNLKPYTLLSERGGKTDNLSLINDAESKNTRFRYFMVAISSLTSGSTIQYSKLRFYNGNINNCYPWCKDMVKFKDITTYIKRIKTSGTTGTQGEEAEYGLMGLGGASQGNDGLEYGKMCYTNIFSSNTITINGTKHACYVYDVDNLNEGRKIDIITYNKWCWHSSNDTASNYGRNMKNFNLYVSDDRTNWYVMDEVTNCQNQDKNYTLIYTGDVQFRYETVEGKKTVKILKLTI